MSLSYAETINYNLTYDGNGNLITGDGKYREYNEFNQLIRVREGNSASGDILETYVYHPTEDRILAKYENYGGFNSPDDAVKKYEAISEADAGDILKYTYKDMTSDLKEQMREPELRKKLMEHSGVKLISKDGKP